jgi:GTPase SAR1 family protein
MNNTITLRGSSPHLRILVGGRTNAGKTTLLKRLCDSDENPEVFDAGGNAVLAVPLPGLSLITVFRSWT